MPEYVNPGVQIEEIGRGPRPIEEVPTSIAALVGETERGSITPRLVTSYADYQRWFGGVFGAAKFMPYAANGFFENGGKRAFISRIVGDAATVAQAGFGDFSVRAAGPGSWGTRIFAKIGPGTTKREDGSSVGILLQFAYLNEGVEPYDAFTAEGRARVPPPALVEEFDDLDSGGQSPETSTLGVLVRTAGAAAGTRPAYGGQVLSGGVDDPAPLGVDDYRGVPSGTRNASQGLDALERDPYRDVALVYAPNAPTDVNVAIVNHCEAMRFRFAVIDSEKGLTNPNALEPRNAIESSHAAFYYPWIAISDPHTGVRILIPPGGPVLGIYARTDAERGVFKAPANEVVRGALAVEFDINHRVQDDLNLKGVNAVRSFPGRGIRVWGARTLSSNTLWKYVNIRRLFIFLERSIYEGTQWVVFESNDERLWARVVDTIRLFLRSQWRAGALVGQTEGEAFFITCDRTTMSQDDILNGRLVCEIGVAPVRPAEFVILRIFQNTAKTDP